MDLELKNKIIVVTGGASGIGESICKKLAEEGAIPCIIDRNEERLQKISNKIRKRNNQDAFPVMAELTDPDDCKSAIDQIVSAFGRIDGLVNNAGLNDGVGLETGDDEMFIASLKINVVHYFSMAQYILPWIKKSQGAIVNICSKTAITGQGGTSGYAAANGERMQLTKDWALELAPYNIRVNGVVVSECWTPQYEWWINQQPDPEQKLKEITDKIPLGNRMTTTDEIADTALFLLSVNAKGINGQLIFVDGGYVFLDRRIAAELPGKN